MEKILSSKFVKYFTDYRNIAFILGGLFFVIASIVVVMVQVTKTSDDVVHFQERGTYEAVLTSTYDPIITKEEAKEVTSLVFQGRRGITDLTELADFENLQSLTLNQCIIDSLDGIENLKNLKTFVCVGTSVDITPLIESGNDGLQALLLTSVSVKDVDALLEAFPNLTNLRLRSTGIEGEVDFEKMEKLTNLDLASNQITKLKIQAPKVTDLNMSGNKLEDISSITGLTNIVYLNLNYNPLENIDGISKLQSLEEIRLMGVDLEDLTELSKIDSFTSIYLDKDFDRSKIEFLRGHFALGDQYTKEYLLGL